MPIENTRGPETASLDVSIRPVTISGEIDIQSSPQLRDKLLCVIRRHGSGIALDLNDVTFIDCAGVNVLLAVHRRAQLEDGRLCCSVEITGALSAWASCARLVTPSFRNALRKW
jgi:anti-anti-sigma factor